MLPAGGGQGTLQGAEHGLGVYVWNHTIFLANRLGRRPSRTCYDGGVRRGRTRSWGREMAGAHVTGPRAPSAASPALVALSV